MASWLNNLIGMAKEKASVPKPQRTILEEYDEEYIRYCVELEQTVSALEAYLHISDDPEEIAMETLKTACDFYGGDWVGLMEMDTDLDVWTPIWWYNPGQHDRTKQLLSEYESLQTMPSWKRAMMENKPVIIADTGTVQEDCPEEYLFYKRLHANSVLATPFAPNPMGFLAIRNPSRYADRPSMVSILAYVLHRAMAQQKTIDQAKFSLTPDDIQTDREVIINFFGDMEIFTSKGVLRERDFKYPKSARVVTYLMLHRKAAHPPMEIANALWPDDPSDPDAIASNIRGYVYRFRKTFELISDIPLIESTPNGYQLNPEIQIKTDLQQFDALWENAQLVGSTSRKVELLKQAMELYRGPVFENAIGEHWIMGLATHYSIRYVGLVNELLATLADAEDYAGLQLYASRSLDIAPENIKAHYWRVYAMYHLGAVEIAKNEIIRLKNDLTPEEYATLIGYIKKDRNIPCLELLEE